MYPLVDNKLKTKLLAEEYGVPTPALQFVVREQHEISHIEDQLTERDSFVLKPAKGSGGAREYWSLSAVTVTISSRVQGRE
jgi:glutathione synthase/RimK-type ligase-like ATP-grasp enzyme